jgi:hypothetical protein
MFHPSFYDRAKAAVVDPRGGFIVSGDPYNGVVLPGSGWPDSAKGRVAAASDSQWNRLFHGLPAGLVQTHNNVFEPRLGVAYAPNAKTAIRAGIGMFHNRTPLNSSTPLGGNPPVQLKQGVSNGSVDNPGGVAGLSRTFPLVTTAWDPVFKLPTAWNWNFTLQRELPGGFTAEVGYVGRRGYYLQRERNINQLRTGTLQANPGISVDALRPFTGYGVIRLTENASNSIYHGLQVQIERRFRSGLGFGLAYTWAKSIDDASTKRIVLTDAYNAHRSRGLSDFDINHAMILNSIYALPFLKQNKSLLGRLLGGWQLSGIAQLQAGVPLSVWRGEDIAGVGVGSGNQPWNVNGSPDPAGGRAFSTSNSSNNYWFNPAVFSRPATGTFGNAGRNIIRGPGLINVDGGLRKNFQIREGMGLQLRWEVFNLPNHPNWSSPSVDPVSAAFGRVTAKTAQRQMQLAVKVNF